MEGGCGLSQKMTLTQIATPQTSKVFEEIRVAFKGNSPYFFQNSTAKKSTNHTYVRIECHSLESQTLIIDYLSVYPLKTLKHISFCKWKKIYFRRQEGVHLSPKGIQRLVRLVKSINDHDKSSYL